MFEEETTPEATPEKVDGRRSTKEHKEALAAEVPDMIRGGGITPERKQELLAEAQRQAELEEAHNDALLAATPPSTIKIGEGVTAAPTLDEVGRGASAPQSVTTPTRFIPGQGYGEGIENFQTPVYGPYDDYEMIRAPWGEYGIPKGHVLWFDAVMKFSPKSGEFIVTHPHHTALPKDAPENIRAHLPALTG